jgi:Protein of unknown function (DUF1566)
MNTINSILKLALTILLTVGLFTITSVYAVLAPIATGDEITDSSTGLIWKRCAEGMVWSANACTGIATTFTHEQALAHAVAQASTKGWRLPNVKELSSIVLASRINPSIDTASFPSSPSSKHWTSTPVPDISHYAWFVDFNISSVDYSLRTNTYPVRLVR